MTTDIQPKLVIAKDSSQVFSYRWGRPYRLIGMPASLTTQTYTYTEAFV